MTILFSVLCVISLGIGFIAWSLCRVAAASDRAREAAFEQFLLEEQAKGLAMAFERFLLEKQKAEAIERLRQEQKV